MAKFQKVQDHGKRRHIAETAHRLFTRRGGFDAVAMKEVAESAGVAMATLYRFFPTKEFLVLRALGEGMAEVVESRPAGQSPLQALRAHYRRFAAQPAEPRRQLPSLDAPEHGKAQRIAMMKGVLDDPAFGDPGDDPLHEQRRALARALARDYDELTAALMAAQFAAAVLTLREALFGRLVAGATLREAGRHLAEDAEVAFDLLKRGIDR
ncbi:MAG TPA: helix-turn-helix domain-containing protein [Nonomuraea sp.]|nr:helix-turn-helix domain-containing protein [Nonomuraea sp.]